MELASRIVACIKSCCAFKKSKIDWTSAEVVERGKYFERYRRGDMKIEMAPQEEVLKYQPEIAQILNILGHPEALVTDKSCLSDFDLTREKIAWLAFKLNMTVSSSEYVVDLARRVKEQTTRGTS